MRQKVVFGIVVLLILFSGLGCSIVGRNFRNEGSSMEPTLKSGTIVWVHKKAQYSRGDIIVFTYPLDKTRDFAKRIVGLPGETVEIKEGTVLISGQTLDEPYVLTSSTMSLKPITVPADNYFVLGDNRPRSNDSRSFGPVPKENILGIVRTHPF